jgi:hypothetical protein
MGVATALMIGGAIAGGMAIGSSLFGATQSISAPAAPSAPPPPEVEEEQVKKFQKKRRGRARTIITGDLTPETLSKKTLLGG